MIARASLGFLGLLMVSCHMQLKICLGDEGFSANWIIESAA